MVTQSLCAVSFGVYSIMPGVSIIHDLGEKQCKVKMSKVALGSSVHKIVSQIL